MVKALAISEKLKCPGLTIWCNQCKRSLGTKKCGLTGNGIDSCPNKESHVYKLYVHLQGTRNTRVTRTLTGIKNYAEAVRQGLEKREEIINGIKEIINEQGNISSNVEGKTNPPRLFIHAAADYLGHLRGENIPAHHKKHIRSLDHVKDISRSIERFTECMHKNGINMKTLSIDQVSDEMVGIFHNHLTNKLKLSNRSYNKIMGHLTTMMNSQQKLYSTPLTNYFEKAERRETHSDPRSITHDEFVSFLKLIRPENGVKIYPNGEKRYLYRHYLKAACEFGLETGRRKEEIIMSKFGDILEDVDGTKCIIMEDYKSNRIKNRTKKEDKHFIYVPITDALWQLLKSQGYESYKGTDTYILAPEIKNNRVRIMRDSISKGFSHFYDQLGTGKQLTFKSLRKTYITSLSQYMHNPKSITGHSGDEVIQRHYIDRMAIAKAAQGFSVFPREAVRNEKLSKLRSNHSKKEKGKEI